MPGPVGEIVFEQYGEILTQDFGEFTAENLTATPFFFNHSPKWSPDGSRIAFASDRDEDFDLYVMDPDGSNFEQLTNDPGWETDPAWSPGGEAIAFASGDDPEGAEDPASFLKVLPVDSEGAEAVTLVARIGQTVGEPTWSPDGARIAFLIDDAVYVVDADGSGLRKVTDDLEPGSPPVWWPDGSRIVIWGDDGGGGSALLTMRLDGADVRPFPIELPDAAVLVPSWSPDGQWLALGGVPGAVSPLYVVNVNGGPVYTLGLNTSEPQWRPAAS